MFLIPVIEYGQEQRNMMQRPSRLSQAHRPLVLIMLSLMVSLTTLISVPFSTAAADINFIRKSTVFQAPSGDFPTSVALGPDGRLYVATLTGRIYALTFDSSYNVVGYQTFMSIYNTPNFNDDGSPAGVSGRMALGITFDPASTPSAPIMYVSHSDPRFGFAYDDAALAIDTQSGTITRLTGPNFDAPANRVDVVTGLPRSRKNHGTNDITFGPDGWLYIGQGGNTSLGVPHPIWTDLPEHYMSAAIVRANVRTITSSTDVRHVDSQADLQPLQGKVELYATGFRNFYDMVWHSNGSLYGNDNGSNPDQGTTPGPDDGCPTGQELNPANMPDRFYRITQGMYGGHPNPARGECILNNGTMYSPPRSPEPNYIAPLHTYDYWGGGVSVDGIDEYPIGNWAGNLISATFSGDRMLRRNVLNANGSVSVSTISSVGAFNNPVDVTIADNGVIFVAEHGLSGVPGVSVLIPDGVVNIDLTLGSVTPSSGSADGGTLVTLNGNGFESGATVTFGGVAATNVSVVNTTTITATTPAHAAGTVPVTVTNPDSETTTLTNGFTFFNPSSGETVARINSGGGSYTGADGTWSADTGFTGGGTWSTSQAIAGTSDQTLYKSERNGNFSYNFEVDSGDYTVILKFAEIYWTGPGQRIFDVTINGQLVLDDFDILTQAAPRTALDLTFPVSASSGEINISFATVKDMAKVSAIEIIGSGASGDTTPPAVISTNPPDDATDVSVETSVSVTFSEPMNKPSAEAAFSLAPQPPPGAFTWNAAGTIMTFSPFLAVRAFDPDRLYTGTIATTATDPAGNPLPNPVSWSFTTGSGSTTPPPPNATSISPASGSTAGGTSVTISGTDFVSGATVTVGGTAATNVTVASATSITATTPAHAAGSVNVIVTNPDGQSDTLTGAFTYVAPTGGTSLVRVNSGGGNYTGAGNVVWSADTGFSGGGTFSSTRTISGTSDQTLYRTERYGNFSYSFPVENGDYTVTLKFAEIYWPNPGQRSFDVAINGQQVLNDFDIVATGGAFTAVDQSFPVTVTNGSIQISFTTVKDNAKVSAIEILSTSTPGDTTPPTVQSASPANNATNVPVNAPVSVTFSEEMDQDATEAAFQISPSVAGSFSWNGAGTALTFTPNASLAFGQAYQVTIGTGAADLAGNTLQSAANVSFTTAAAPDTTPPAVQSTNPANNATGVAVSSTISVTFSEPMSKSATQSAFQISPAKSGSFSWNGAGTVMTFTPISALTSSQNYTVTIGTGATDLAGNPLQSAHNWTFTTATPPPPDVTGISPSSGSTGGGTSVTISGTNFANGATVSIGGTAATNVTVVNSTTITATTPAHAAGAVSVVVTNPGGQADTLTSGFTYTEPQGGTSLVRVNSGGGNYTGAGGVVWSADTGFSGGGTFSSTRTIGGTSDQTLYRSERYGNFSYTLPVENGTYTVTLKFAEIYWSNPGQRSFDVSINGQQVLDNFDIVAAGGAFTAVDRTFEVTATNGSIQITFTTVTDNAKVSAIEIVGDSGGGGDTTPPTVQSTNPANNATNVAVGSAVSVTFSEAMNKSATQSAFQVSPSVAGSFSWNAAGTVMTFTPNAGLAHDQTYQASVGTGAEDLAGNPLQSAANWSFTTAEEPSAPAPDVTGISPASGSTAGGTAVTISGSNFASGATVTVGGTAATGVTVVNASTITATTPAHTAGAVNVVVTNADGQSDALSNGFTYTAPPTGTSLLRINSGGSAFTDSNGDSWAADAGFTGGGTYTTGYNVSGTSDQALYRTERTGNFSYAFNVDNGDYTVTLKFAEIYWATAGRRIFDVSINGQLVLDNFDIVAHTDPFSAYDQSFPVTVSGGSILITFSTVLDNAKVSGIEITADSGGGGDTTPPTVQATNPASNATNVGVDTTIAVTFSEPMDQDSVEGAFQMSPAVAGSFSWNGTGTVMTFIPDAELAEDEQYQVSIGTGATDLAGNPLPSAANWSFTTAAGGDPGLGQWIPMPPMPESRAEVGVVESGGIIYVMGGVGPQGLSNKVFAFNLSTQTWSERAPYPGPAVDHAGAAAVNGTIYLIGGLTSWPSAAVNTLYAYNPATNTWTQKANLPRDRGAMGVAVLGGKIYAAGGLVDGGTAVGDLTVYDPQTDTWTELTPMPTPRDHLSAEAINGKFHAMGGRPVSINSPRATHEAYDPATDTWETRASLPSARAGHGSAVLNGKIVIFGGEGNSQSPSGTFENTDEYDPVSNTWRSLAPMVTPRHGMDGAVYNNVIYVPGGGPTQGGSHSTTHEAFSLLNDTGMMMQTSLAVGFGILIIGWFELSRRKSERRD